MIRSSDFILEVATEAVGELLATYNGMLCNLGWDVYGAEDYAKNTICERLGLTEDELKAMLDDELVIED